MNKERLVKENEFKDESNYKTKIQKNTILEKIRKRGFRLTSQREILLDIILENECASCKEIYYKATQIDEQIGIATVYRMVNILEDIGAINRKNLYKITYFDHDKLADKYSINFEDGTTLNLSVEEWNEVVRAGLSAKGYSCNKPVSLINDKNYQ